MSKFEVDFIIKNGRVIDPLRNLDRIEMVAVKERRVVELPKAADIAARWVFDAAGCIVVPGLIDFHCHYYNHATTSGLSPEIAFLSGGVTTAVDQGSAGIANCRNFLDNIAGLTVKTKLYLNVSAPGQAFGDYCPEPLYPDKWDRARFRDTFAYGNGRIIGLKLRVSKKVVRQTGADAFYESVRLAEDLNTGLAVHLNDPPMLQSEIAAALRQGDVMTHIYHGEGNTIYEDGRIAPAIRKARERGVLMDVAHGGLNLSFDIARRAVADGFLPDIISSDLGMPNWLQPDVYNLPYVMSQFLAFGMELPDIIRCVTATPARALGQTGQTGTLLPGAWGDITVLKLKDMPIPFCSRQGEVCEGRQLLVPQAVFADGALVYKPLDSSLTRESELFGRSL